MIDQLPTELVIDILQEADELTLFTCRLVCRTLNDIIVDNSSLIYQLKLSKYGYHDVPTASPISSSQRLALLISHILKWSDPRFEDHATMGTLHGGSTYELQGGLFIGGNPSEASNRSTRGLIFTELPWKAENPRPEMKELSFSSEPAPLDKWKISDHSWTINDLGIDVHDFQADPSQDLLILVEKLSPSGDRNITHVHARTLGENSPHPQTISPVHSIELPVTQSANSLFVVGYVIQVLDDVVGILTCFRQTGPDHAMDHMELTMSESRIDIYNWKTGESHGCAESFGIDSFVFLDQRTLLLARRIGLHAAKTISLEIYDFTSGSELILPRQPVDFPQPSQGLNHLTSLLFAAMPDAPGTITTIVARCEPCLSYRTAPNNRTPQMKGPQKPFRPGEASRLIVLSFITLQPQTRPFERHFAVMLRPDAIRDFARRPSVGSLTPWPEWGPSRTRWFETRMASQWICYTHAGRFAAMEYMPTDDADLPDDTQVLKILDFNPSSPIFERARNAKTQDGAYETATNKFRVVTTKTSISGGSTWVHDIESELPYAECVSKRTWGDPSWMAVMIDDDRLIVTSRHDDGFTIYNI